MTESEFNEIIDNLIMNIEDQLDNADTEIDYETSAGILTITMENNSQIIVNRQASQFQLWLAAKSGGYHFEYINEQWLDTKSADTFIKVLNDCIFQQSGEQLKIL